MLLCKSNASVVVCARKAVPILPGRVPIKRHLGVPVGTPALAPVPLRGSVSTTAAASNSRAQAPPQDSGPVPGLLRTLVSAVLGALLCSIVTAAIVMWGQPQLCTQPLLPLNISPAVDRLFTDILGAVGLTELGWKWTKQQALALVSGIFMFISTATGSMLSLGEGNVGSAAQRALAKKPKIISPSFQENVIRSNNKEVEVDTTEVWPPVHTPHPSLATFASRAAASSPAPGIPTPATILAAADAAGGSPPPTFMALADPRDRSKTPEDTKGAPPTTTTPSMPAKATKVDSTLNGSNLNAAADKPAAQAVVAAQTSAAAAAPVASPAAAVAPAEPKKSGMGAAISAMFSGGNKTAAAAPAAAPPSRPAGGGASRAPAPVAAAAAAPAASASRAPESASASLSRPSGGSAGRSGPETRVLNDGAILFTFNDVPKPRTSTTTSAVPSFSRGGGSARSAPTSPDGPTPASIPTPASTPEPVAASAVRPSGGAGRSPSVEPPPVVAKPSSEGKPDRATAASPKLKDPIVAVAAFVWAAIETAGKPSKGK